MTSPGDDAGTWQRLHEVANRLSVISREHRYDVHCLFAWPDTLPPDRYWISPELMTCYGTAVWNELDEVRRLRLSHLESVNFFSLNVHLIRELIGEVADRIYTTRFPGLSEFFHDFIAEENDHAWFFATYCQRYGGKLYQPKVITSGSPGDRGVLHDLTVFGRILIAEEVCDFFNTVMAEDRRLPEICQQINRVHHQDEARHIAFGRQMMRALCQEAVRAEGPEQLAAVGKYLARYLMVCVSSFYNRDVYREAGLPEPARLRARLLEDPVRAEHHRRAIGRSVGFLSRIGVLDPSQVRW